MQITTDLVLLAEGTGVTRDGSGRTGKDKQVVAERLPRLSLVSEGLKYDGFELTLRMHVRQKAVPDFGRVDVGVLRSWKHARVYEVRIFRRLNPRSSVACRWRSG